MKLKPVFAIVTLVLLGIVLVYYVFMYNSPPTHLDNKYLLGTEKIEVYSSIEGKLINQITDRKEISHIISKFKFTKLPSGSGLMCATKYDVKFITPENTYNMYFDGCEEAEIIFPEHSESNKWDSFWRAGEAGTLVPVYTTGLESDIYNKLIKSE
jgi:hypothetical protein